MLTDTHREFRGRANQALGSGPPQNLKPRTENLGRTRYRFWALGSGFWRVRPPQNLEPGTENLGPTRYRFWALGSGFWRATVRRGKTTASPLSRRPSRCPGENSSPASSRTFSTAPLPSRTSTVWSCP